MNDVSDVELSNFAALCEALLLINEKEADLERRDPMAAAARRRAAQRSDGSSAIQEFVFQRGKQIHAAFLTGSRNGHMKTETNVVRDQRSQPQQQKAKCLHPKCNNKASTRGLCASCYAVARQLVKEKKVSWDALEKSGRALEKKGGGTRGSYRTAWFLEA